MLTNYITEWEMRELLKYASPESFALPPDSRLMPEAADLLSAWRRSAKASDSVKPESMTHLRAGELVCKNHPQIQLRGKIDSLESDILLLMCEVRESWRGPLGDALLLLRQIMAADVKDTPLPDWKLDGMDAETVHRASHHPQEFGFPGHVLPSPEDGRLACQLNRLRAASRECELSAMQAYFQPEKRVHEDSLKALNRLSSYFYILQLRAIAENRREKT